MASPEADSELDVVNPLKECLDAEAGDFSKCCIPGLDYVVFGWGSGPHCIEYGNEAPKEVIVSRKCAEAVLRGAQVGVHCGFLLRLGILMFMVIDCLVFVLIFRYMCLVYWLAVLMLR